MKSCVCIYKNVCRLLFQMLWLRRLNVNGPHTQTPSSNLFWWDVRNTSHQLMPNSGVQQSTFCPFGMFTISCAMLLIQVSWHVQPQVCSQSTVWCYQFKFPGTTTGTFTYNGESMPKDKEMVEPLPLSDLCPYVFSENGVPAQQIYEAE